ncbi:hypothetical protein [Falsibacillus albus]|uniref:VCBS repeat-containing protein n=1 Tax=Falsibacillus albus TaxID=2478915 RepID=A0A3L7JX76_9BACI|nr:hypothetical protein [Falsibacillus albus]RLQ95356.1 hypothetical protein D9X91_09960 [Falsibacillus albus]
MKGVLRMKYIIAGVISLTAFLLSGCSIFETNTALLSPPSLPVQKAELKESLTKFIPSDAVQLTPVDSKKTNNIFLSDLDNDGTNEAVIFYKVIDNYSPVHGVILKKQNGWNKIGEIVGSGSTLGKVEFADLTGDGKKEVIIGYGYNEQSDDRGLNVYELFNGPKPAKLLESAYNKFVVNDLNEDGQMDLAIVQLRRNELNKVQLYENKNGKLVKIDELSLDPFINGYENAVAGRISDNRKGILLDASIGAHSAVTFVVAMEKNHLINVFPTSSNPTFKPFSVYSQDKNKDGILEIGLLKEPILDSSKSLSELPYITEYVQLDETNNLVTKSKWFINNDFLYDFRLPDEWPEIKIEQSKDKKYTKFIQPQTGKILFDVYVTKSGKEQLSKWKVLAKQPPYIYLSKTANKTTIQQFHVR